MCRQTLLFIVIVLRYLVHHCSMDSRHSRPACTIEEDNIEYVAAGGKTQ